MRRYAFNRLLATLGTACCTSLRSARSVLPALLTLFGISAADAASCYPVNTPMLVFSTYHPVSAQPQDIDTVIEFSCAPAFRGNQLLASVSVQPGFHTSEHQLRNAVGDTLRYALFIDPARSIPLTDHMKIPLRDVNPATKTFSIVLYGRIFAHQKTAGVGNYRSFVNLQLDY